MARPGLERCDIWYDVTRLRRKRAYSWNKESEFENSDIFRFKRQIRKTKNMDEDYVQYLMLLLDYDEESCYTNEGRNEGHAVGGDRLNHDVDEEGDEFEDEEEDEDDLEYKKFLANAKPSGNSLVARIDGSDGFPVFVEFEKEDGADEDYEYLGRRKQQDSDDQKDLGDVGCKDKVESQPSSRIVLEYDNNISAGDNNIIIEPFSPVTRKEKELTNQELSLGENGACKRRRKGETEDRSNKEQKKGKGRRSTKITTKEEGVDIDEDYSAILEKFICKNWRTPTSFMRKYNLARQRQKSSRTVLENDSNISVGDIDMTHEPSDRLSPKVKRKRGRPRLKDSTKGNDASNKQGKGEKRKRSDKEQTARKGRKLADVSFNEDAAGTKSVNDTVKEEITDADEAPFKSGHSFECNAADEDLQIVDNDNCTFGKEGSSNLVEVFSAKHSENVGDSCPRKTVRSDFWWNVKALLERPYDQKEYTGLWKAVKTRKPTVKDMDLRNGKFYLSRRLGKSYLDHYKDLHEKLKEVDNDNIKKLHILRSFFFWVQNLTQEGAFRPWTDPEWLALVDNSNSTDPTLASNE